MTGFSERPMTSATAFKVQLAGNAPSNFQRSKAMDITGINFFDEEPPKVDCK